MSIVAEEYIKSGGGVGYYEVSWSPYLGWCCQCLGFYFRGRCSHVDKLKEELRLGE